MSNEEQVADTIEMLYERLNSYNKQDLFNYGYLLESNEILCKDIEEKDKEIERLNNILDGYEKEMDNLIDARDKAIEYIELRSNTNLYDKNKLLEILKGSDSNDN